MSNAGPKTAESTKEPMVVTSFKGNMSLSAAKGELQSCPSFREIVIPLIDSASSSLILGHLAAYGNVCLKC